jgi:ABC-type phosphate transport system substrate-binding protein
MPKQVMPKKSLKNRHISLIKLCLSLSIISLTEGMITAPNLLTIKAVLAQNSPPENIPTGLPSIPAGTKIRIDGSQTLSITNQALKKSFEEKYPGTVVEVAENGADQGLQELLNGQIDLLAIGHSLTEEEKAQGLVQVPLRREKIAIIIGENNPFQGNLTFEEFARIWRGEITDWSEVGGQPGPIRVVDRPPATNDTRLALQNYPVFADFPFVTGETAETLETDDINQAINRLGSDGISYAIANQVFNRPGVKIVVMHQTLPDDPRYPFSQPLYYVYKKNQLGAGVPYFLGLINAPIGQQIIEQASSVKGGLVNSTAGGTTPNANGQVNSAVTDSNTGVLAPNANGQINTAVTDSNTGIAPNANGQINTAVTGANTGITPNANGQINTAVTGANTGIAPNANGQVNSAVTGSNTGIAPNANGQVNSGVTGANTGVAPDANGQVNSGVTGANTGVAPDANGQVNSAGGTVSTPSISPNINGQINNASPNPNNNPNNINSQVGNVSDGNTNNLNNVNPNNTSGTEAAGKGAPLAWLWWLLPLLLGAVGLGWLLTKQKDTDAIDARKDTTNENILEGKTAQSSLPANEAKSIAIPPVVADTTEHDDEPTVLLTPVVAPDQQEDIKQNINQNVNQDLNQDNISSGVVTPPVFPGSTVAHDLHDHDDDEETVLLEDTSSGNLNTTEPETAIPKGIDPTIAAGLGIAGLGAMQAISTTSETPNIEPPYAELQRPLDNIPEVNIPDTNIPEVDIPEVNIPDTNIPEVDMSATISENMPEVVAPELPTINDTPPDMTVDSIEDSENNNLNNNLAIAAGLGVAGLGAVAAISNINQDQSDLPAVEENTNISTNISTDLPAVEETINIPPEVSEPVIESVINAPEITAEPTINPEVTEPAIAPVEIPEPSITIGETAIGDIEISPEPVTGSPDNTLGLGAVAGLGVAGLGAVAAISNINQDNQDESDLKTTEEVITSPVETSEAVIETVIKEPVINSITTEPVIESVIVEPAIASPEISEPVIETVIEAPIISSITTEPVVNETAVTQTPTTTDNNLLDNTLGVAGLAAIGGASYLLTDFTPSENADVPPIAESFTGEISTQKPAIPSMEIEETVIEKTPVETPDVNIVNQTVIEESAKATPTEIGQSLDLGIAPIIEETSTSEIVSATVPEVTSEPASESPDNTLGLGAVAGLGLAGLGAIGTNLTQDRSDSLPEEETTTSAVEIPESVIQPVITDITESATTTAPIIESVIAESAKATPTEIGQSLDLGIAPIIDKTTEATASEITAESLAKVDEVLPELPASYGESRIYLMPRDPHSAYAYWDVLESDKINLQKAGGRLLALRLYDVTDIDLDRQAPHSMQQYECDEMAKEWFFGVPMSDRDYVVEIGYVTDYGEWLMLARSLPTHIPPLYPSEMTSDQFVTINWFDRLEDKTWQIPQEVILQPGLPIVQGSHIAVSDSFNRHLTASGMGMSGVGLTASGMGLTASGVGMSGVGLTASGMGYTTSGVGLTASGIGMSGVGLTTSGIGYTTSGMGYTTSGVGMSGIGMIYTASGIGYSASGIGYTTSGVGYTTSGVGYTTSGVGYTTSGMGLTTSGIGYTTSGMGLTTSGIGYTTSGIGYTTSGMGIGYTTSGMGLTTSGIGYTTSGAGLTTSGVGYTTSGIGIGYTTSGMGLTTSGIGYTTSGMGLTTSGIGYTTSGMGLTTSGIGYTTSGMGLTTSGVGYTTSGMGLTTSGIGYTTSGIGLTTSGIGYTTSGAGLTTSGVGYTTSGIGIGYTTSGMGLTTSGIGYTTSGAGLTTSGIGYTTSGVGLTTSGIGYTTSGAGLTTSGIGYTTSGVGLTTSGIGYTTSGAGLTTSGIGYTSSGMGYTASGMNFSGIGFGASMPPISPRKFWLIADAELIVHGATEPDAKLTIGGEEIQLSPDGTFHIHISFPDGEYNFPIKAVAADGEQNRQITLEFNRETPEKYTNSKEEAQDEWPPYQF